MRLLLTGAAGFIGFHTARELLARGDEVIGFDNLSPYYDVDLKLARLRQLEALDGFSFVKGDVADHGAVKKLFTKDAFERVIHLAAQPGVRHSLAHPHEYARTNLVGFLNILEGCRYKRVEHLVFASSSSVYGANTRLPFSVHDNVDHPTNLYAATKKSNELMAHTYAHMFGVPTTGLRFFTVYGPWGRPDMALFTFTQRILAGAPIDIFNNGENARDFTYIDDIVEGILRVVSRVPTPNPAWSGDNPDPGSSLVPYRIYNLGNRKPIPLLDFVSCIEGALGKKAEKILKPPQPGEVPITSADMADFEAEFGPSPSTPLNKGVEAFVEWYRRYYAI